MDEATVLRAPVSVTARRVRDEVVLLDMASESYFGLNPVAACVFEALRRGGTVADAARAVEDAFDAAPDVILSDVTQLVGDLVGRGLLEIV